MPRGQPKPAVRAARTNPVAALFVTGVLIVEGCAGQVVCCVAADGVHGVLFDDRGLGGACSGGYRLGSIVTKLLVLEGHTVVLPGHGLKTTIGLECRTNPFLEGL
jgi:hypothetical protein